MCPRLRDSLVMPEAEIEAYYRVRKQQQWRKGMRWKEQLLCAIDSDMDSDIDKSVCKQPFAK